GLFNGSTREVNSPLHPDFGKLGTIFWVIEKTPVEKDLEEGGPPAEEIVEKNDSSVEKVILYDTASIPIEVLLADRALMRHLEQRASVRTLRGSRGSSTFSSPPSASLAHRMTASVPSTPVRRTTASIASSPSPFPVTPDTSRVLVPSTPAPASDNVVRGSLVPTNAGRRCDDNDDDDEVEFVGFLHPNGAILPDRPVDQRKPRSASGNANTNGGNRTITINIVAWAADTFKHEAVKLPLASGQYMRLSMVSKVLQRLRLDINSDLDRFIPGRGWTPILMNTLFMVKDGDVVSLKSSTVHEIRDFEIQMAHLY
ncbi:hypothetical protein FB446DRAFT_796053, partial [Lentinula raphanica]